VNIFDVDKTTCIWDELCLASCPSGLWDASILSLGKVLSQRFLFV
jgi:hypothetical protein